MKKLGLEGDWYFERLTRDEVVGHRVRKRVAKVKTPFQTVEVVDTHDYGRCLFLDGLVQSTEADEFIYHEALVHPALLLHPKPETVFIAGGGEGAPLREILKHPSVKKVVMVEIDEVMVRVAKRYLKTWHAGAFADPRVELVFQDARSYLEQDRTLYDALFLDLCDPGEAGPARRLFTLEFYSLIRQKIKPSGTAVIQAGSSNVNMLKALSRVALTLKQVFKQVVPYQGCVSSYVGPWAFMLARRHPLDPTPGLPTLSERVEQRRLRAKLRFYDPKVHERMFVLPPYLKKALSKGRAISDKKPLLVKRQRS